jgi:hypothetical protein
VQAAQAQGDENARRILEEHRALLRRCREVGIGVEQAFAALPAPEQTLLPSPAGRERGRG